MEKAFLQHDKEKHMKWISLEKEKPPFFVEILFTDGKTVFFGWYEVMEECLAPEFYSLYPKEPWPLQMLFEKEEDDNRTAWPTAITHWMHLPKPPM